MSAVSIANRSISLNSDSVLVTILQFLYQDGTASTLQRQLSVTHYEHIEHSLAAQDALSLLLVSH